MFDLAGTLFGNRRDPVAQGSTLTATGSTASADGTAYLAMDADVTPAEGVGDDTDQTVIDVPTSPSVAEGDEVIMTLVGDGPLKTPVVMANPGFGDRMQVQVDNAETLAQQAEAVATATGQHFWHDSGGAHVTEATREDWETAQTGPNSLWNSLGMLFRDGLNNLMAVLTSGIAIYDGNGNTADHILAEFTSDHVRVGGNVPDGTGVESSVQFFDQTATHDTDMTASTYFDGASDYQTMQSTVNLSSTLADEGKTIDTGSSGTAALDLVNMLENGISDVGEQHNEVTAALVADASYSDGAATSHAAVRATASTTGDSGLSYAELIGDALGIGENEGAIDYFTMDAVRSAFPVTLYDNASASASAAATLSETAANFSRLTIFYRDSDGNHASADVWQPDGKRVALAITWISGARTQEMYQRVRWVTISGTSISTYKGTGDAKYRTGQVKLGATASVTNSDYISIVHVIGWR